MDIQKLIDDYTAWLKSQISYDKVGEYFEITTPFLDNNNDYLQFYIKCDGDDIYFTDDGITLNNLTMNGVRLNRNRKDYLNKMLYQYNIKLQNDELTAKSSIKTFPQTKHLFVQAMLKIEDTFSLTSSRTQSLFFDDIQSFFTDKEIYYTDNVQFAGISGFSHKYDFLLQRTKNKPERLCQAVNIPNKNNMSNILFSWNDTKQTRNDESQLILILNDQKGISKGVVDGFKSYGASVIKWSEREKPENIDQLSAV